MRMPIGGSASCTLVRWPAISTVPSLPSEKSPPSGITDHTRNAGTNARNGAMRNTTRSARFGSRSSLKISFMPSASVCSRPHGPALFGPTRFCMPDTTLRSYQTMNIVPTRPIANTITTLNSTMINGVHRSPPSSKGSRPARAKPCSEGPGIRRARSSRRSPAPKRR